MGQGLLRKVRSILRRSTFRRDTLQNFLLLDSRVNLSSSSLYTASEPRASCSITSTAILPHSPLATNLYLCLGWLGAAMGVEQPYKQTESLDSDSPHVANNPIVPPTYILGSKFNLLRDWQCIATFTSLRLTI